MEYLIGLITWLALFVVVGLSFYAGWTMRGRQQPSPKQQEPDEQEQRRMKEFKEGFQHLMNYDVNTALKRKGVT